MPTEKQGRRCGSQSEPDSAVTTIRAGHRFACFMRDARPDHAAPAEVHGAAADRCKKRKAQARAPEILLLS